MTARVLISREEAAALCGVSVDTFDRHIRPRVATIQIGRRLLVNRESAELFRDWMPPPLDVVRGPSRVYFIQAASGRIKIGRSQDVDSRLRALQTSSAEPLELLASMPGGTAEESKLHRRFATQRRSGEWFDPTYELLAFIASLPKGAP